MLDYARPTSSSSSSHILMLDAAHHPQQKLNDTTNTFFLHKPHTVQIIQLVECTAPPPRPISSVVDSSEATSSYDDESNYYSSSTSSTDDQSDEEEADCSSYCSSDLPPQEVDEPMEDAQRRSLSPETPSQTQSMRMKRILLWREDFSSQLSKTLYDPSPSSPLKRKIALDDGDDDVASQSSKRSRSHMSRDDSRSLASSLCEHACPACDALFETRQQLRQHGRDAAANEACCVAVDYAFE